MKKWTIRLAVASVCIALTGCGSFVNISGNMDTEQVKKETAAAALEIDSGKDPGACVADGPAAGVTVNYWTEENQRKEIAFLEEYFGTGLVFEDMDDSQAESYGADIGAYYDFVGRVSEDGFGYVLGFLKGTENPFKGRSQYWQDGVYVIAEETEKEKGVMEEKILYSMEEVNFIDQSNDYEVIFLQPVELELPEEIRMAFLQQHCNGDEGRAYLQDVTERQVRLAAPEEGAYLEVYRYENGMRRREYIPLTAEEEARIMNSDALILPEWYGGYGLQFFMSQEKSEETGEELGSISVEALRIAEERCRYVAMDPSEIHDLVKAEMKLHNISWEDRPIPEPVTITDPELLKELETIFSGATAESEGKCPYRAVVTLTRADGKELTVTLAVDSCDGFILGSCGSYYMGNENAERVWRIFEEIGTYIGRWGETELETFQNQKQ